MDLLALYMVVHDDGDGNNHDWFVTGRNPEEAFALWRCRMAFDPTDYPEETVRVFAVPVVSTNPQVEDWPEPVEFRMGHTSLTTQAVELNHKINYYRNKTDADV